MKITITIETDGQTITVGTAQPEPDDSPQILPPVPTGTEAITEHGNHDSTPRYFGFSPEPANNNPSKENHPN